MPYRLLVERWRNETLVFVAGLPGCVASGPTDAAVMPAVPAAIAHHLAWLRRHGLTAPDGAPEEIAVAETAIVSPGGAGPRFALDLVPPADTDIALSLRIADATLATMAALYEAAPAAQRRPSPDGAVWTMHTVLHHIAALDHWYVGSLPGRPTPATADASGDPLTALAHAAHAVADGLWGLTTAERGQTFVREGEEWTAAKVIRRRTGHLHEHLPQLDDLAKA